MKLRLYLSTLLLALVAPAFAQQGRIVFDDTTYTFAEIAEGEEPRHNFTFRNEGTAPLRLLDVEPACGCTTPEWTRDAVAPGEEGVISVVYLSEDRPGRFKKTIDVTTDGTPSSVRLYIAGTVRAAQIVEGVVQGNMFFAEDVVDWGTVAMGRVLTRKVRVQNNGKHPIRFEKMENAGAVRATPPARPVFHNDVVEIQITLVTAALEAGQPFDLTVSLPTDDTEQPVKTVRLTGTVTALDSR